MSLDGISDERRWDLSPYTSPTARWYTELELGLAQRDNMSMHHDNVVVAIQSASTPFKTFREYDHDKTGDTSSCNLVIPFDTEYQFLIKVLDDVRRRAVVTIDGIEAFDLILGKGSHVIERFGETSRKFKFVKSDNPAVTDPTSALNGRVEVRIYRERPFFFNHVSIAPTFQPDWNPYPRFDDNVRYLSGGVMCGSMSSQPQSYYSSGDVGATIEGGKSDQSFGRTVWNGDDSPCSVFVFRVRGKTQKKGYCVECGEQLNAAHKFCGHCGTRV